MTRWMRQPPERRDDVVAGLVAGAAGALVGAGVFWLVRLLTAREPLPEGGRRAGRELESRGTGGSLAESSRGAADRIEGGGGPPGRGGPTPGGDVRRT